MTGEICTTPGCTNEQLPTRRVCSHCRYIEKSEYHKEYGRKRTRAGCKQGCQVDLIEGMYAPVEFWQDRHPMKSLAERERLDRLQREINISCARRDPPPIRGYVHFGMLS